MKLDRSLKSEIHTLCLGGAGVFGKTGYITAGYATKDLTDGLVVTLRKGHEFSALCTASSGQPLEGVTVSVSVKPFFYGVKREFPQTQEAVAVTDGESLSAVYLGTSDDHGVVSIKGIPAGSYQVRARHEHYVPISGGKKKLEIPAEQQQYVFEEPYVGLGVSPTGKALSYYEMPGAFRATPSYAMTPLVEVRRKLLRDYPEGVMVAGLAAEQPVNEAHVSVFWERHGFAKVQLPLRRYSEVSEATRIGPTAASGVHAGTLKVRGENRDGTKWWDPRLKLVYIAESEGEPKPEDVARIDVDFSAPMTLPAGKYVLMHMYPETTVARELEATEVVIVAGGSVEQDVVLRKRLQLCRFEVELPFEENTEGLVLEYRDSDRNSETLFNWRGEPPFRDFWLPTGLLTVAVGGGGCARKVTEFMVRGDTPCDEPQVFRVQMEYKAD